MRFMIIVKASKESEAGVMPSQQLLADMGKFNEELTKAGVMLAGEGLHASSKGARVRFAGNRRTVVDGPFAETKELIAGYWIWQVRSKEEAIEWVKRCPNPHDEDCEIEIRQLFEAGRFLRRSQQIACDSRTCGKAAVGGARVVPVWPVTSACRPWGNGRSRFGTVYSRDRDTDRPARVKTTLPANSLGGAHGAAERLRVGLIGARRTDGAPGRTSRRCRSCRRPSFMPSARRTRTRRRPRPTSPA